MRKRAPLAWAAWASALLACACGLPEGGGSLPEAVGGIPGDQAVSRETGSLPRAYVAIEGKAILVRGSAPVRGLPFLKRNAIPALSGTYAVPAADGQPPLEVPVWYSEEPLLMPEDWKPVRFPGMPAGFTVRESPPGLPPPGLPPDISSLVVAEGGGYRLFIGLPGGLADPARLVAVLAERFDWFRRYAANPADISFPAVLETAR